MATYPEIAPIISGTGTTKTSVENYFSNLPEAPTAPVDPTITKAKVKLVADAFFLEGIEKSRGISGIARLSGLRKHQVKSIIKELMSLKSAWEIAQLPPEPEPEPIEE